MATRSALPLAALPLAIGRFEDAVSGAADVPLDSVTDAIGATYALLFAERVADGGVDTPLLAGVDPAYGSRLKHAGSLRLLPGWLRGLEPGSVTDRAVLQRDHEFARSPFFDYVVRPEGRFHCLITTPYVTPSQRFHLIVGRPIGDTDFSPADIRMLQTLLPYLGRLIRSGVTLFQAKAEAAVLQSTFDRLAGNILVVTGDCRLIFANRGAQHLLDLRDGLHCDGTGLKAADQTDHRALRNAIARALDGTAASDATLQIRRISGSPSFTLSIIALPLNKAQEAGAAPDRRHVMLLIEQADVAVMVNAASLARSYKLTAKECELALLLAGGLDLHHAAARLGISYNTVRFHMRHVFEKTDTHRQCDLLRLMLGALPGSAFPTRGWLPTGPG